MTVESKHTIALVLRFLCSLIGRRKKAGAISQSDVESDEICVWFWFWYSSSSHKCFSSVFFPSDSVNNSISFLSFWSCERRLFVDVLSPFPWLFVDWGRSRFVQFSGGQR